MDSSVVRMSLFVSNNYNMVVIYQPYTSIKYARYITILKHGGYRFNQPETTTDSESSWKSESYILLLNHIQRKPDNREYELARRC